MAGADYIFCNDCGRKLIYDPGYIIRQDLIDVHGKKYELICPHCIKKLKKKLEKCRKRK